MRYGFCVTAFLYAKEGGESTLLEYENAVLPILEDYGGKLLLRIRPDRLTVSAIRVPDEIHLIGFSEEKDFRSFLSDPKRQSLEEMKKDSIFFSIFLQGTEIRIPESFYLNNG